MAQISPKLMEQTIKVFENLSCEMCSQEDARQAVENICGFFQVLQDWDSIEENEKTALSSQANRGGK